MWNCIKGDTETFGIEGYEVPRKYYRGDEMKKYAERQKILEILPQLKKLDDQENISDKNPPPPSCVTLPNTTFSLFKKIFFIFNCTLLWTDTDRIVPAARRLKNAFPFPLQQDVNRHNIHPAGNLIKVSGKKSGYLFQAMP